MNSRLYQSEDTGDIVEAARVPERHRQTVTDYMDERVTAEAGDWIILHPWVEVIDDESFTREYEEL
jgi:hypothetical protein